MLLILEWLVHLPVFILKMLHADVEWTPVYNSWLIESSSRMEYTSFGCLSSKLLKDYFLCILALDIQVRIYSILGCLSGIVLHPLLKCLFSFLLILLALKIRLNSIIMADCELIWWCLMSGNSLRFTELIVSSEWIFCWIKILLYEVWIVSYRRDCLFLYLGSAMHGLMVPAIFASRSF